MQTINEIKEEIYPIFEPIIGTIRLKTYFSYYAVFKDGLMIALYQNGATYLRIAKKILNTFVSILKPVSYAMKKLVYKVENFIIFRKFS